MREGMYWNEEEEKNAGCVEGSRRLGSMCGRDVGDGRRRK